MLGKKTVLFTVEHDELETVVRTTYGITDYHFAEVQECGNDTQHKFIVEPEYDETEWKDAEGKYFQYRNNMILNRLCYDGHIEAGEYLIVYSY